VQRRTNTLLLLPFVVFVAFISGVHAQGEDPQYLTAALEQTARKSAAFYRVANGMRSELYVGTLYSMDGRMKAEGTYADAALTIPHGAFVFYHSNGEVESRGNYQNGHKAGVWERYDQAGRPLAEKIYDPEPLANIIYTRAQVMPRNAMGGERELVRYIKDHLHNGNYPKARAKVMASFVVEKSGALTDVKVIGGKDPKVDQGVVDAIQATSPWEPGMEKGQPVRVQVRMPVNF
jgi:TonB family protein